MLDASVMLMREQTASTAVYMWPWCDMVSWLHIMAGALDPRMRMLRCLCVLDRLL